MRSKPHCHFNVLYTRGLNDVKGPKDVVFCVSYKKFSHIFVIACTHDKKFFDFVSLRKELILP